MTGGPVVRQLGDRPLFIGDRRAADPSTYGADRNADYDAVLTVASNEATLTTHHHPLRDGPGNPDAAVAAAIDTARALHRSEGRVLVHCAAGISRSATVLAATLAAEEHSPFPDALGIVQRYRERACPHPALREQARAYLQSPTADPEATDPGRGNRVPGASRTAEVTEPDSLFQSVLDTVFGRRG